ncbi:MAG: hypothetical protein P4K98_14110 [Bryobacteraceae bacterium]|nr:hypothetical protein [Bryobacteraceae bacterium]
MLKIRPDHMNALAIQQAGGFTRRMMVHLRAIFPVEVAALDDEALKAFVEKVCAQAEEWGIVEEPHVERLIELFVAFEALRRNPLPEWVREIVAYPNRSGEHIVCRLEDRLIFGEAT